ncbi:hypothetical protein SANTM175S_04087 [Streptomyces antimycoticus]
MPSPSWLTEPSIATSRAASAGRPAAKTPKGAARMASPSLQACRCWAEMGAARPRRRFSSVPRSLKPAPRNGPSSRSAIHSCQALSTWAGVRAEPCRASSSPEKIVYSVSSVPDGVSATKPSIRPQRSRICDGFRFSAGAPRASPTARPSRAPRARSCGVRRRPGARGSGNAGDRCHTRAFPQRHLSLSTVLGWREVPVAPELLGATARSTMPAFRQVFVTDGSSEGHHAWDCKAFVLRKRAEREVDVYFPSLSARTIVYKGMLTTGQLEPFFPDLSDRRFASAIALVHSRFSTNTFPSWPLAHPYRFVAHNGEINTVKGNRNWTVARESQLVSDLFGGEGKDLERIFPICTPDASDSASFDEVLELLHLGGRSLPHSVLMMIPEAWENHDSMEPARRAFYEFHSTMMEPWDGPACVTFTDGKQVGAVLDRNGLRPGRYWVTDDGLVVLGSEVGVLDIDPAKVVRKGRLQPGRMFLVDTVEHRIIEDDEIKAALAAEQPYAEWLEAGEIELSDLPEREHIVHTHASVTRRQQTFWLHRGGAARHPRADGQGRCRAHRFDGHRLTHRRALLAPPAALRLLHRAVRAGHQPAAGRDPRRAGHLPALLAGPQGNLLEPSAALLMNDPALPGDRQRRAGQAHPHQRRRRHARLQGLGPCPACTGSPAAATPSPPASRRSAPRPTRPSRTAPG